MAKKVHVNSPAQQRNHLEGLETAVIVEILKSQPAVRFTLQHIVRIRLLRMCTYRSQNSPKSARYDIYYTKRSVNLTLENVHLSVLYIYTVLVVI